MESGKNTQIVLLLPSNNHVGRFCKQSTTCGIHICGSTHHRLLHRSAGDAVRKNNDTLDINRNSCKTCSFRTVPVIPKNGNTHVNVNALLDDTGSGS